jgi:CelD/BcsL family acetyltransferase involved in cellulose biosynthesis
MATAAQSILDAPMAFEPATGCRVSLCRTSEIDPGWAAAWDQLASQAAEPNVFMERWFMRASLDHLDPPESLRLAFVWSSDGALIGVATFFMARRYGRMLLSHVQTWSHYHSFLGSPLVHRDHVDVFWTALLKALDTADWADGLVHLTGLVEGDLVHRGLVAAAAMLGRPCDTVHRTERAALESHLSPTDYYESHMRKKKRKEINRLQTRLAELGTITYRRAETQAEATSFAQVFLTLEHEGWKGRAGSALACSAHTNEFFLSATRAAWDAGKLDIQCLSVNDQPIAVLVNFLALPGSFSYKIAFDEAFARYSPGVLIQINNLNILDREGFGWMDSCAVENHPMINSLWAERRTIIRVSVPLGGLKRGMVFRFCRTAEESWAKVKSLRRSAPAVQVMSSGNDDG